MDTEENEVIVSTSFIQDMDIISDEINERLEGDETFPKSEGIVVEDLVSETACLNRSTVDIPKIIEEAVISVSEIESLKQTIDDLHLIIAQKDNQIQNLLKSLQSFIHPQESRGDVPNDEEISDCIYQASQLQSKMSKKRVDDFPKEHSLAAVPCSPEKGNNCLEVDDRQAIEDFPSDTIALNENSLLPEAVREDQITIFNSDNNYNSITLLEKQEVITTFFAERKENDEIISNNQLISHTSRDSPVIIPSTETIDAVRNEIHQKNLIGGVSLTENDSQLLSKYHQSNQDIFEYNKKNIRPSLSNLLFTQSYAGAAHIGDSDRVILDMAASATRKNVQPMSNFNDKYLINSSQQQPSVKEKIFAESPSRISSPYRLEQSHNTSYNNQKLTDIFVKNFSNNHFDSSNTTKIDVNVTNNAIPFSSKLESNLPAYPSLPELSSASQPQPYFSNYTNSNNNHMPSNSSLNAHYYSSNLNNSNSVNLNAPATTTTTVQISSPSSRPSSSSLLINNNIIGLQSNNQHAHRGGASSTHNINNNIYENHARDPMSRLASNPSSISAAFNNTSPLTSSIPNSFSSVNNSVIKRDYTSSLNESKMNSSTSITAIVDKRLNNRAPFVSVEVASPIREVGSHPRTGPTVTSKIDSTWKNESRPFSRPVSSNLVSQNNNNNSHKNTTITIESYNRPQSSPAEEMALAADAQADALLSRLRALQNQLGKVSTL